MTARPRPTRDQATRQARRDRTPAARRPWPILTDRTAIDRARTTARLLLDACHSPDPPAAADAIAAAVREAGETWLTPVPDLAPDDRLLTEREAGQLVGLAGITIRQWRNRGVLLRALTLPGQPGIEVRGGRMYLRRHPGGYLEADVLAFDAAMRADYPTTEQDPAA